MCTARKLIFAALDVAGKVPEKFVEVNIICLLKVEETTFFKEYMLVFLVIFETYFLIVWSTDFNFKMYNFLNDYSM